MKSFYTFIYLDEDIIEALYPQVFDSIIEKSITQTAEESFNASVNANILNLLGSNGEGGFNNSILKYEKSINTIAKKTQLLINYIYDKKLTIQKIINDNQPFKESFYFVDQITFFLSDIYNKDTGCSIFSSVSENIYVELNSNSVIILESGKTDFITNHCSKYMDTDDYYKTILSSNAKYGIVMHLSNSKIKKNIHHLTSAIEKGKRFKFYVFGELIQLNNEYYKTIPFALWQ